MELYCCFFDIDCCDGDLNWIFGGGRVCEGLLNVGLLFEGGGKILEGGGGLGYVGNLVGELYFGFWVGFLILLVELEWGFFWEFFWLDRVIDVKFDGENEEGGRKVFEGFVMGRFLGGGGLVNCGGDGLDMGGVVWDGWKLVGGFFGG